MKKTIEKINDTKSWLFEKINKIDKPLARLIKKIRDRAQINKITKNVTVEESNDPNDMIALNCRIGGSEERWGKIDHIFNCEPEV